MKNLRTYYAFLIGGGLPIAFALSLMVLVFAFLQHKLSITSFRLTFFALLAGLTSLYIFFFRKLRTLPPPVEMLRGYDSSRRRWRKLKIWNFRVLIALMIFSLVVGNWAERDGPLAPRLIGTVANLGMTRLFWRGLKAELEKQKQ